MFEPSEKMLDLDRRAMCDPPMRYGQEFAVDPQPLAGFANQKAEKDTERITPDAWDRVYWTMVLPDTDQALGTLHFTISTSGFPFSTIYVANSAALPLPTFCAA
jgi:hypothetical protein